MTIKSVANRPRFATFVVVWAGQLVSTLGSGLSGFAVGIWLYEVTGSPTLFSLSLLVYILPNILLSPVAGVVADRWDRRKVMLLADTGAGLATLFLAVMLLSGNLQIWHVYVAGFFDSAFSSFQWPAYSAATTLMVPKKHLARASGMTQIGQAVSQLATPAIAGALYVAGGGLKLILLIDLATYFVALATLIAIRFPQPEETAEGAAGKGSFWQEAMFGWKYIVQRKGLFGMLLVLAAFNLFASLTNPLYIPYLLEKSSVDAAGIVFSVFGAGTLVGTLIMSTWGGPKRKIVGVAAFCGLFGVTLALLGLAPTIPLIAAAGFAGSMMVPMAVACSQAIWQVKVAQDVQGRVFAIRRMIAWSTIPISYLLAGPLNEQGFARLTDGEIGPAIGLEFIVFGILIAAVSIVPFTVPAIRRVEIELPDAVPDSPEPVTEPRFAT